MRTDGNGLNGGAGSSSNNGENDNAGLLDEELNSAAAPFLYLLASVTIAAGGYLLFSVLRG